MAQSALEDGIDPVYVSKYACIRVFLFTSKWAFKRWCVVDDSVNIGSKKIVADAQGYIEILVSDRSNSTVSIATKQYPVLIKNLSPFSEAHPQFISSVPFDLPLSWFDPKLFTDMRDKDGFLIPYDFYMALRKKQESLPPDKRLVIDKNIEDFFKNEEIKNYHCGEGFSYSDQLTHFAGIKEGGYNGFTIDLQPIVPFDS